MFSVGSFAKIWDIKNVNNKEGFVIGYDCKLSTSRVVDKTAEKKEYVQDFGGFVKFFGEAKKKVESTGLKTGDTVKILSCGVKNKYDKEKKITFYDFLVFDFSLEQKLNNSNSEQNSSSQNSGQISDSDLPF